LPVASSKNRASWALGLRNPFKFAVKPATSLLFINDVGGQTWEEINWGQRAPITAGPTTRVPGPTPSIRRHSTPTGTAAPTPPAARSRGIFYNPATVQFPKQYVGKYFFTDLCNGFIRTYGPATRAARGFATGLRSVVDLEVSKDGELYYLSYLSSGVRGSVGKISYGG
jgi:glucose/arabinose dehydrogenase